MAGRLVLASASPRRRELLRDAGVEFDVMPATVPEIPAAGERADGYVLRVAREKASAVDADGRPVLGADTEVVLDGRILGKPRDADDARAMLRALSGRSHQVMSAVALRHAGRCDECLVVAEVHMREISDAEIDAYLATDEPWDKAGGYAVQGRAAAFVDRVDGSYTAVVGLPMDETLALLRGAGIA